MTQYIYICGQQRVFNTAQVTICLFFFLHPWDISWNEYISWPWYTCFFHHNDNQHQRWTKLKKWPIVQVVSVWFNLKVWQGMTTKIPHFYILSSDLPWTKPSVSIGGLAFLKVWPRWTIWLWLPWILGSGDTLQGWPWRFSMFFWHKNGHAINGNVTFNS